MIRTVRFERFYRVDKSRSKSTGGTGRGIKLHAISDYAALLCHKRVYFCCKRMKKHFLQG